MSKTPKLTAAMRKEALAGVSAKRQANISLKSDIDIATHIESDTPLKIDDAKEVRRHIEEAISLPSEKASAQAKTLPKVTLYAHQNVLKAIRRLAVDDGVQAQEILRRAVRDYLATRGHHFTDLTTGQ